MLKLLCVLLSLLPLTCIGFSFNGVSKVLVRNSIQSSQNCILTPPSRINSLRMNFFEDAFKFVTNMKKEASAKHILISGADAYQKLEMLKSELESATEISTAFSELAAKVSECPSAKRGGNLGTFKPGMMVKEFDEVVFNKPVGVVHGPITTQFGSHLILITRRYEGEDKKS
mmetsp:Transcript_34326/g.49895  ORF Transcript_34326/g.49895 Transcript_34326/m.49895 type:complete len:172 (+) Transcript_34326:2432-2947(+)